MMMWQFSWSLCHIISGEQALWARASLQHQNISLKHSFVTHFTFIKCNLDIGLSHIAINCAALMNMNMN